MFQGTAQVTIVDNCGDAVADASVTGSFSIDLSGTSTDVTDASGVADFASDVVDTRRATYEFCTTDVTHASLAFDGIHACDGN